MRSIIILILLCSTSLICLSQDKFFSKNTIVYGEIDLIRLEHYNAPKLNPKRETIGFRIGVVKDILATPNLRLDVKVGYRRIIDYANPQAIKSSQIATNDYYHYNGANAGLGMNIGMNHSWESSILIGGGFLKKSQGQNSLGEMELGLQTGYMYISEKGLVFRTGGAVNFVRNGSFSNMFSGYLGFGYALQRKRIKIEESLNGPMEKGQPYFNVNASLYTGNLSLDIFGVNLRADHFVYNGRYADLGYGLSARIGANFDSNKKSFSASFVSLLGERNNKFEFSVGLNAPLESDKYTVWEFIHVGLGYRYVSADSPITFRIGTATTSILHFGIGVKFPN